MYGVSQGYTHSDKRADGLSPITLQGARLKWYDIALPDTPVAPGIRDLARSFLAAEAESSRWELGDELGFVLLHRCGQDFHFLIVCTWRGNNELWETVYSKEAAMPNFAAFPQGARHKGTYCVWEMAAVWHETKAWRAYLSSARSAHDADLYLGASFSGAV
jgi:hypothetical protein